METLPINIYLFDWYLYLLLSNCHIFSQVKSIQYQNTSCSLSLYFIRRGQTQRSKNQIGFSELLEIISSMRAIDADASLMQFKKQKMHQYPNAMFDGDRIPFRM